MRDDFAVFILTHGRPEACKRTIRSLKAARYTGPWYLVLDDEDTTRDAYAERWGEDRILTFNKDEVAEGFDLGDNGGSRGVIVYARNATEKLAQELGVSYYLQLDDDYNYFAHRLRHGETLAYAYTYRFDEVVDTFIDFLEDTGALTVAFAQGGDFIGGVHGAYKSPTKRKAMNSFFARTGRPIGFVGRINEDVNTYVWRGGQGDLFLTVTDFSLEQPNTQGEQGGMTGAYLGSGTYTKSFYTVMWAPSCVKISTIGETSHRLHHQIAWNNAVPKIVPGSCRKVDTP